MTRWLIPALVLAFAAASCGGGDDGGGASTDATAATSAGTEIVIEFENGEPVEDVWRQDVSLGDEVSVIVSGDRDEQVHVHGYDLYIEPDDGDTPLRFDALIPGRFEIELEQSGRLLLEITVS